MALTPQNIFKSNTPLNLNRVASGVVLNEIAGLGKVETYGRSIAWRHTDVLKDGSIITEKRDRFDKRNELLNAVAEAGSFEYALAVAPSINGKRVAQCSFCGAHHNWVVFYRSTDGRHLGWSGTDCFGEICRNLKLPAADAMIEAVKTERARCERFRKTMEKINDFKRDFPNLYEDRDLLASGENPDAKLWWAVRNRLNSAEGVDEKWLEAVEKGAYDHSYRVFDRNSGGYRVISNQDARKIPQWLQWTSNMRSQGIPLKEVFRQAAEKKAKEQREEQERQRAAMAAQQPAPVPQPPKPVNVQNPQTMTIAGKTQAQTARAKPPTIDELQQKAKALLASGRFGWSKVVEQAVAGEKLSVGAAEFILKSHRELPVT